MRRLISLLSDDRDELFQLFAHLQNLGPQLAILDVHLIVDGLGSQ
jgi:hypothetical protein